MRRGYLVLENGRVFEGLRFGAERESTGELVFTTNMVGYLETLTDPGYLGQIVVQTFPSIGNYGVIPSDFESLRPWLTGYIVREWCESPSNFRCEGDLHEYLQTVDIPGLCGLDTRALTRLLRTTGVMRAKISDEPFADFASMSLVTGVSSRGITVQRPEDPSTRVALWDFGVKNSIMQALLQGGCEVHTFPADIDTATILACKPDRVLLSNGPGDPTIHTNIIENLNTLIRSEIPIIGIGLGHQLLALAFGAKTAKLKYGHRGANQPVQHLPTGRVYATTQNHGYAVQLDGLPFGVEPNYVNTNDGTCEGLTYTEFPAESVQFHDIEVIKCRF